MRVGGRHAAHLRFTEGRWLAHRLVSRAAKALPDAERWRPWRSYAQVHLWRTLTPTLPTHSEEY